jgi:hypothetical protein
LKSKFVNFLFDIICRIPILKISKTNINPIKQRKEQIMRKCIQQRKALRKVLKIQKMKRVKARKTKLEQQRLASNSSASRVGEILSKIGRQKRLI